MPVAKLKNFLDENRIKYVTIQHSIAYTSQEVAAAIHIHGSELAKTTVVKLDGRFAMAVLAAPDHVDLDRLKAIADAKTATLATEKEFMDLFPGCDLGAMPPFGNLYGLPVYVDERLAADASIAFNAGTHTEAIRMDFADFKRLVEPRIAGFRRGDATSSRRAS
jgi:Ala-tRNA(Pro) deacylase